MSTRDTNRADGLQFESEVSRIARTIWPTSAQIAFSINDREADGIYATIDSIYCIEATISRRQDKAEHDIGKLCAAHKTLQSEFRERTVKCIWVTKHEPTPEQDTTYRNILKAKKLKQHEVAIETFSKFRARLIDAEDYLDKRKSYPFGSIDKTNLKDLHHNTEYISMDIIGSAEGHTASMWTIGQIGDALSSATDPEKFLLLGDFGSGKSMTTREVYRYLSQLYNEHITFRFPLVLNLRDHYGQDNPEEAIYRHAQRVGFPADKLTNAWRSGYAIPILDGFDELSTARIIGTGTASNLREARRRASTLITRFVDDTPHDVGIFIAGRTHYFDSVRERDNSLGTGSQFIKLNLSEFNDSQVSQFLNARGQSGTIPAWLPTRPLLLGSLVSAGFIDDLADLEAETAPSRAWNLLLARICDREANQSSAMSGEDVRGILERLSTLARKHSSGIGPIHLDDVLQAFRDICERTPDDQDYVQIMRLPGLGTHETDNFTTSHSESPARHFIDEDLADAARGGDLWRFINSPVQTLDAPSFNPREWDFSIDDIGLDLFIDKYLSSNYPPSVLTEAIKYAARPEIHGGQLASELLQASIATRDFSISETVIIDNCTVSHLALVDFDADLSSITFRNCIFDVLELGDCEPERLPRFTNCLFSVVRKAAHNNLLTSSAFSQCEHDEDEDVFFTTDTILNMPLAVGARILVSVLRKLFLQRGAGRQESALYRGLNPDDRKYVKEILPILISENIAYSVLRGSTTIWIPQRQARMRAMKILSDPLLCTDPALISASSIQ